MEVRQFSFCAFWSFMKSRMPATSTSATGAAAAAVGAGVNCVWAVGATVGAGPDIGVTTSGFFFLKMPPRIDPRMLIRSLQ
ncbi:hypothetical protein D3C72_1226520 [compost metagenome]